MILAKQTLYKENIAITIIRIVHYGSVIQIWIVTDVSDKRARFRQLFYNDIDKLSKS